MLFGNRDRKKFAAEDFGFHENISRGGGGDMRYAIRLVAALAAMALLLWMGYGLIRGMTGLLNNVDLGASEPDPMFAEDMASITMPPDLFDEGQPKEHPTLDDYVMEVETPVDKTADELIREAIEKADAD